ncbi:hypothetical protein FKW77_004246 [Venturia effusa]|uniref:G-protein coupled receptors family 2 profile 2 domain-containing protein n=1 Tax=Venturia effusa TaxID=50376 RepID=A0A517LCA4_9PEZI|nr:hypothetical protein FKW77_004246 [Venturia effusa]
MFIAIHAALQVFRPNVTMLDVDDGLYAYRLYAYLAIFLAPITLSSLAFVNKDGYISQGVFCALPRSPSWARLVLAWIPRFVIALVVIVLAIGVYVHVSRQLAEFTTSQHSSRELSPRERSPKVSMKGSSVVGGNSPPLLSRISLPFPKRKQKAQNHLAGIDEEEERRRSSVVSTALPAQKDMRPDPTQVKPPTPPILSIPRYNQTPTQRLPITPGLVSPGAVSKGSDIPKDPDYFSIKPLAPILKVPQYNQSPTQRLPITPGLVSPGAVLEIPGIPKGPDDFALKALAPILKVPQYDQRPTPRLPIDPSLVSPEVISEGPDISKGHDDFIPKPLTPILKVPQYNQGSELTPITPGLVSPGTSDPRGRSPVMIKDFAQPQMDYFDIRPPYTRRESSDSSIGASSPYTQPWDNHGQLPQFMPSTPNSTYSIPSRQPTPPGRRAPGRRVSIEEPFRGLGITAPENLTIKRISSSPLPKDLNVAQRDALKKSLGRVFVYPAIFVVFWIPPCIKSMLALSRSQAENRPLWLAVISTLCLTLMGTAYCLVFLWSEQPWRHFVGTFRFSNLLPLLLCRKRRDPDAEDGYLESPAAEREHSIKAPSLVSDSTGHTLHSATPSQNFAQHLSKMQAFDLTGSGRRNSNTVVGRHQEQCGSATSLATTTSAASRAKSISFATVGQHLAGGSTTSLAKQLALERLQLEQQDRRNEINFRRRLSMRSGPSRMSSKASVVTSLGSITEVERKEWWDEEEVEVEEIEEVGHSDDDL